MQMVNYQYESRQQFDASRHPVQKKLDENLPSIYILIHSVFQILIGLTAILLQIVLITNKGPYYWLGHGIWGGALCIGLAIICLLLVRKRLYSLFVLSLVAHTLTIVVLFGAFIVINIYAVIEYSRSSEHRPEDKSLLELNVSMLVTGVVAIIVSMAYVIIISWRMR